MPTLIIHHDDCLRHDTGPRHPERPARITAVLEALAGLGGLEFLPAPKATPDQLQRVHPDWYCRQLAAEEPAEGRVALDPDTFLSPGSIDAALRGSGAICFAIDEVLAGKARNAFCATRPPGHHAEAELPMGFCLFNHVAVGACHGLAQAGCERVAIIDFDVHHGNGTQAIFAAEPRVLYVSSHQSPLYPGTGLVHETGVGNILNLPLEPGAGGREFREAWTTLGLPAVHGFEPDLVLISAGFDAHRDDPLAQLELVEEDFHWISAELRGLAEQSCAGRLVSTLEGGYDLGALGASARAHVDALCA